MIHSDIKNNTISLKTVLSYYKKAFTKKQKIWYGAVFFFQIMRTSVFVVSPFIYKKIFDFIQQTPLRGPQAFSYILSLFLLILGLRMIAWIAARLFSFTLARIIPEVHMKIKNNTYEYLMRHSHSFFTNHFVGGFTHKVNKYTDAFWSLSDRLTNDFLPLLVRVIGIVVVLSFVDARLAVAMFSWIFIFILISLYVSKIRRPLSLAKSVSSTGVNARLSDTISNQNSIASYAGFTFEHKEFSLFTSIHKDALKRRNIFDAKVSAIYSGFIIFVEVVLIGGSFYLWSRGEITLGTIILMQSYIISLLDEVWGFSRVVQAFEESYSDAREMVEILETPHDVIDQENAQELTVKDGLVQFKDVSFSYKEGKEAFHNLSLIIRPRQKVGLVGPSGAGKTTFVKLLLRFYDVSSGAILIDGQNIKEVTQDSLREQIAFVPQDPALFHRSLMENIRYGRRNATDEEVLEAAKKARCHDFIISLPEGYSTLVGERGIKLSGGERQRVAVARAILKNVPILVLDEATSALDSESERLIQDALKDLMQDKTVIVIAHRLSTIQTMDRIIVFENGKVVEDGSHQELLSKGNESVYKKLWQLQAGGFIQ